jgi:hypothetical protein
MRCARPRVYLVRPGVYLDEWDDDMSKVDPVTRPMDGADFQLAIPLLSATLSFGPRMFDAVGG